MSVYESLMTSVLTLEWERSVLNHGGDPESPTDAEFMLLVDLMVEQMGPKYVYGKWWDTLAAMSDEDIDLMRGELPWDIPEPLLDGEVDSLIEPLVAEVAEYQEGVEKHLPGKHDQSSHAGGRGGQAQVSAQPRQRAKPKPKGPTRVRDLAEAVRLLADGEQVMLDSTESVNTLVEELYRFANEAKEKGEKAPNVDLCKVSVPGTNLFCGESLGVERHRMPQLSGKPREGSVADGLPKSKEGEVNIGKLFTDRLAEMGVDVTDETVPAASLRASQKELVGGNVAWMMKNGDKIGLDTERIFVSSDGYVIDGHHRWAAQIGLDSRDGKLGNVPMNVQRIDMPIERVLEFANQFADEVGVLPKAAKRRVPLGVTPMWEG